MSGVETETCNYVTGTPIYGHALATAEETQVDNVASMLQAVAGDTFGYLGLWRQLRRIDVWNPERTDAPPRLREVSSLYYPAERRIELRTWELNGGQLAHELGHLLADVCDVKDRADAIGKALWRTYGAMRGADVELFAEDFRHLFFPDENAHPPTVPGLRELFLTIPATRGFTP